MISLEELTAEYTDNRQYYLRVIRNLLPNGVDEEDLLQQAFYLTFKNRSSFRGECKLKSWITTIVRNCCFEQIRKRNRRAPLVYLEDIDKESIPSSQQKTVEQNLIHFQLKKDLHRGIQVLKKREREAVTIFLSSGENLTGQQWYKSSKHRAIKSLRNILV